MSDDEYLKDEVTKLMAATAPKKTSPGKKDPAISQTAIGDGNIQVGGDLKLNSPPPPKEPPFWRRHLFFLIL